jgi:hypothetical protein
MKSVAVMDRMLRIWAGAAAILALASVAHAGDQGDPDKSCDGETRAKELEGRGQQ